MHNVTDPYILLYVHHLPILMLKPTGKGLSLPPPVQTSHHLLYRPLISTSCQETPPVQASASISYTDLTFKTLLTFPPVDGPTSCSLLNLPPPPLLSSPSVI